jgi:polyhydroxybutyrate depolymerase
MSNGAMLSHRLGAERPDLFAAIGPVAGTLGGQRTPISPPYRPAAPSEPVSAIMFHGQQDRMVPYSGGQTESPVGGVRVDLSQAESAAFWVSANECDPTPTTTVLANGNVIRETYVNPATGAEVALITVVDGGHSWPGASGGGAPATRDISATDEIWSFFAAHPKR